MSKLAKAMIDIMIATVFIPIYFKVYNELGEEKSLKFVNNIVVVLCTILAILGLIFTQYLVKLFAVGFEGESLKVEEVNVITSMIKKKLNKTTETM